MGFFSVFLFLFISSFFFFGNKYSRKQHFIVSCFYLVILSYVLMWKEGRKYFI